MKRQEKELFKSLCSYQAREFDKNLLKAATPTVLGQLFFNRMQTIAYGNLKERGLLGNVNREFRNSLKDAYEQNLEKNKSFFWGIHNTEKALSKCTCKYAMLKGAYLCKRYPAGYRTSNDIDLLVRSKDVAEIGEALRSAGFRQGNVRNGSFVPATRRELIESRMMRGETVPYIKEVDLPGMQFLEVDINFSLNYKPDDGQLLDEMIANTAVKEMDGLRVQTLRKDDFFMHLCIHLYKEAATLPWVEMMRDMTLYKYADIYMLLNKADKDEIDLLFTRAKRTQMEKICAFAVMQMSELFLFDNQYAVSKANEILSTNGEFLHTVVSPKDKKVFIFKERDISARFFADNRKALLEEVKLR